MRRLVNTYRQKGDIGYEYLLSEVEVIAADIRADQYDETVMDVTAPKVVNMINSFETLHSRHSNISTLFTLVRERPLFDDDCVACPDKLSSHIRLQLPQDDSSLCQCVTTVVLNDVASLCVLINRVDYVAALESWIEETPRCSTLTGQETVQVRRMLRSDDGFIKLIRFRLVRLAIVMCICVPKLIPFVTDTNDVRLRQLAHDRLRSCSLLQGKKMDNPDKYTIYKWMLPDDDERVRSLVYYSWKCVTKSNNIIVKMAWETFLDMWLEVLRMGLDFNFRAFPNVIAMSGASLCYKKRRYDMVVKLESSALKRILDNSIGNDENEKDMNDALLTRANYFQMVGSRLYWDLYAEGMLRYDYQTASSVSDVNDESRCSLPAADSTERTPFAAGNIADVDWRSQQDTVVTKRRRVTRS